MMRLPEGPPRSDNAGNSRRGRIAPNLSLMDTSLADEKSVANAVITSDF